MKHLLSSKLSKSLVALTLCGAAYAAVSPLAPPRQEGAVATDHHARVTALTGRFEGKIKMIMPGVDEPMMMNGTEVITAVGELWTTSRFEGDFMGTPFEGASTLGYDTAKNKYVGTWIDSMTTALILMEGEYDADKDAIVMHYENFDPMRGEMVTMRTETVSTEDGYVAKFYEITDEGERLSMQMDMKRVAKPMDAGSGR